MRLQYRYIPQQQQPTKQAGPIGSLILGIIVSAMGASLIYFKGWPEYQNAKQSIQWPKTTGIIIRSKLLQRKNNDNQADISYSYVAKGRQLKSSQLYIGSNKGSSFYGSIKARKYIKQYPAGHLATVYYSPKDETNAVLDPGVKIIHYMFLVIGALFLFAGLSIILSIALKLLSLIAITGFILGSLFEGRKKRPRKAVSLSKKTSSKKQVISHNPVSSKDHTMDIDLESEMSQFNKVASSSLPVQSNPWKHDWIIKIDGKKHGPLSFKEVVLYLEKGKIKEDDECYLFPNGKPIKIKDIVYKKAA